jgi:hypothetical protein
MPGFAIHAQGIATSGIRGVVRGDSAQSVDDALVRITQVATGFAVEVKVRDGRFFVQGLEPGGPYSIALRRVGFAPQRRDGIFLKLGELLDLQFVLMAQPVELQPTVVVAGEKSEIGENADGGTATTIGGTLLHQLPTLNRDLYDFVPLAPQVSTKIGLAGSGLSAGGVGFRYNDYLINGVSERTLSGNVSNAFGGSKSIPLDAVEEYQVLLSPYDVRYGDFAGAMVNAVTMSGTNTFHGSAFAYGRNNRLGRAQGSAGGSVYDRVQSGFSIGGPVVRDRLRFFVASEFQHFAYPADGPYVGQQLTAASAVPVSDADLARLNQIIRNYGLTAGSAGPIENGNPLSNIFSRLDLALPSLNSRAVIWNNYAGSSAIAFSRGASPDTFSLSSYQVTTASKSALSALQLETTLSRAGGGHNELLISLHSQTQGNVADVHQPIVRVLIPNASGSNTIVNTGTHETAQGLRFHSSTTKVTDDLTLSVGASHVITLGGSAEYFNLRKPGVLNSYGTWTFASLDNFELGIADRYEVGIDLGNGDLPLTGAQYAGYIGDQWQPLSRLSLTGGLRGDVLVLDGRAPYNAGVDSLFGQRTDEMPRRRLELSPRIGFNWDVSGDQLHRIRGGLGVFTGRFPLAWVQTAMASYGAGAGLLHCGNSTTDAGPPPPFNPDYAHPPTSCSNGIGLASTQRGDVDLLDRNLRMMRTTRGSLAYDAQLPGEVRFTEEALVTRGVSDLVFVNLNLPDSVTTDRNGRVMYGSIAQSGIATPRLRSGFSEVIDLRNAPQSKSYEFSTRLEKNLSTALTGVFSYTYSRARDAETPLRVNNRGTVAWASARTLSGRDDDLTPGTSSNDIPHRVVLAGTYAIPALKHKTSISLYYIGESGRPFTYIATGALRRGDLNADGSNANDPIYVPRDAFDASEIRFDGSPDTVLIQQTAFERLIEASDCLRHQRGKILARNSCREPWSNITVAAVRQSIPLGRHTLELQLDAFNVLNLIDSHWGLRREAVPPLLQAVGQTAGSVETSQSIFHFDTTAQRWTTTPAESAFQLQLAVRYTL